MTERQDRNVPSGGSTVAEPRPTLTLDAVLEVLSNRGRRFALYSLSDAADGVTDLGTLIEDVVTLESALDGAAVRRDRYLEVARDLYHWHLPVLADVGVLDRDDRHETIRYLGHPTLETWLARIRRDELGR